MNEKETRSFSKLSKREELGLPNKKLLESYGDLFSLKSSNYENKQLRLIKNNEAQLLDDIYTPLLQTISFVINASILENLKVSKFDQNLKIDSPLMPLSIFVGNDSLTRESIPDIPGLDIESFSLSHPQSSTIRGKSIEEVIYPDINIGENKNKNKNKIIKNIKDFDSFNYEPRIPDNYSYPPLKSDKVKSTAMVFGDDEYYSLDTFKDIKIPEFLNKTGNINLFDDARLDSGYVADISKADAVTIGSDIFISKEKGENLSSPGGKGLLMHEYTHSIQQHNLGQKINNLNKFQIDLLEQEALNNEIFTTEYLTFSKSSDEYSTYRPLNITTSEPLDSIVPGSLDEYDIIKNRDNNNYSDEKKSRGLPEIFTNSTRVEGLSEESLSLYLGPTHGFLGSEIESNNDFYNSVNINTNLLTPDILNDNGNELTYPITYPEEQNNKIDMSASYRNPQFNIGVTYNYQSNVGSELPLLAAKDRKRSLNNSSPSRSSASELSMHSSLYDNRGKINEKEMQSKNNIINNNFNIDAIAEKVIEILERKIKIQKMRKGSR